jgi:hypothetical protein
MTLYAREPRGRPPAKLGHHFLRSLVDREENEYEGEFLADVAGALGIGDARADELREKVRRTLSIGR